MEKVINIDGNEIPLKVTFGCVRMYKLQFRRDLIRDIFKMKSLEKVIESKDEEALLDGFDFELFSNLLWLFAKKADASIGSPEQFEDRFTAIPYFDIMGDLMEMVSTLLDGQKK